MAAQDTSRLPVVRTLEELAELVGDRDDLYVRWSRGPDVDACRTSRDELSGVPLPGLSASALGVEPWWEDRDRSVWVARRLYDYRHLRERRSGPIRPWALEGRLCGRGPDNEPLVTDVRPVAWIDESLIREARERIEQLNGDWGSLDRPAARLVDGAADGDG